MAGSKKSASRKRAWIVFEDEAGASLTPVVRRTWARRGQTPVLRDPFNWDRISMAVALAYRWDGRRSWLQVVDLFHSKERLSELARLLFRGDEMEAWRKAALDELDAGEVGSLLDRLRAVDATRLSKEKAEELGRALHYFTVNRKRTHYAEFRVWERAHRHRRDHPPGLQK